MGSLPVAINDDFVVGGSLEATQPVGREQAAGLPVHELASFRLPRGATLDGVVLSGQT
jgi:hypothetical protein